MVLRVWHLLAFAVVVVATALGVAFVAIGRQAPTPAANPKAPVQTVSLGRYLAEVKVQQDRFLKVEATALAALDPVGAVPDANWQRAAATLRDVRDQFTDIAIKLRLIQPPSELAAEHRGLTKSVELFAASDDGLRQALADSDQQGVIDAAARLNDQEIVELRTAWRNAVVALAQTQRVAVPHWTLKVGTRS